MMMTHTLRRASAIAVGLLAVVSLAACGSDDKSTAAAAATHESSHPTATARSVGDRVSAVAFGQDMRKLWEQHVTWTRLFIVSAVAGSPDTQTTAERLLKNQDDIGNAIKPLYGDDAGTTLTTLLRTHITTAADLVAAAKTNDQAALTKAKEAWYANADDIAELLSRANRKNWPADTLKQMMRTHLDQTLTEATDQLTGNYTKSIADYDEIEDHILAMADTLADGIVAQFPDRFTA